MIASLLRWWRSIYPWKPSFCDRCGNAIRPGEAERCDMCGAAMDDYCQHVFGNCRACHVKAMAKQAQQRRERWAQ